MYQTADKPIILPDQIAQVPIEEAVNLFLFKDSEGDEQKGKKLVGDCKEILLAPQGIGVVRKNIKDFNL